MGFPGITNYIVKVPGTDVTAYLAQRDVEPDVWVYTLWAGEGDDEHAIATGDVSIPQPDTYTITPRQIANIAFLLEVEYPAKGE